jgi:GNAT superfamily N-acetyltransferase
MHTAEAARGHGIGRAMLTHLLEVARTFGVRRVSLETGTTAAFAPARTKLGPRYERPVQPSPARQSWPAWPVPGAVI